MLHGEEIIQSSEIYINPVCRPYYLYGGTKYPSSIIQLDKYTRLLPRKTLSGGSRLDDGDTLNPAPLPLQEELLSRH